MTCLSLEQMELTKLLVQCAVRSFDTPNHAARHNRRRNRSSPKASSTWCRCDLLPRWGTFVRRECYHLGGQKRRCPMRRLPNKSDDDFPASPRKDNIDVEIAELFSSRPLGVDEFFADPTVRMRIRMLITRAMNKPTRPQRRGKPR
jgi:hypothetical protein